MSYSSAYQFSSSTYEATSAAAAPTLSVQSSNAGLLGGRSSAANQQTVSQIANDLVQLNQSGRLSVANALTSSLSVHANANANAAPCQQQQQAPPQGKKPCVDAGPRVNCNNAGSCVFLSEIEQAILRSSVPVEVNETEEITVLGETGLWANKQEVVNWKGVVPIAEYAINEDCDPEVITKRTEQKLEYVQELAIRYLRPPTPPPPGEILIKQEVNTLTPPAPPLIIRQQPPRPSTPEPLVIREAPPQPPPQVCQKVITISGKRLPPPPRKVVIERLAPLPSKPQSVIVERWLPYSEVKRRVIFQRSNERDAVCCRPRNVIVQWEAPQVNVRKEIKYLGVIRANPAEYVQRYGASLKLAKDLPEFVLEIKTPDGLVLAADYQYNSVHELEGDLQAFKLVDLDKEGLAEYRAQLAKLGISFVGAEAAAAHALAGGSLSAFGSAAAASAAAAAASGSASAAGTVRSVVSSLHSASSSNLHSVVNQIFEEVDRNSNGRLEVNEAEKVLLRLNSALGRSYGEDEVNAFFEALDADNDGTISLEEFRAAFEKQF